MPYNKTADLPDYIKKLSKRLRDLWRKTFNSAYAYAQEKGKSDPEAYAFKVANAAVKKAKTKKKESVEIPDADIARESELDGFTLEEGEVLDGCRNIVEHLVISLEESKIDIESRTAEIVAITEGWSKNNNYYSKEVAESLANLLVQRRKIFANHTDDKKYGRDVRVWAATVEEAKGSGGKTTAKIHFTPNPATSWLLDEAKTNPSEVQFSIDALARVHEGEMLGKKGLIVDKFVQLNSLDVVDYAAAGGVVQRTCASKMESDLSIWEAAANTLKDRVAKYAEREKVYALLSIFYDMLSGISWSYEEEEGERKEKIEKLVDEFLEEFDNLDIVKAFESIQEKKDGDSMTLEELKKAHPELVAEILKEASDSRESKAKENESFLKEFVDLKSAKEALELKLKAAEDKVKTTEDALKVAQDSLNTYKEKEILAEREKKVRNFLAESKLRDKDLDKLPEYVKKDLLSKDTDEKIKEAIAAYESLVGTSEPGITGAGVTSPAIGKQAKGSPNPKLAEDANLAATIFN